MLKQLNEYLDNRVYDLDVSDLCINATCNALQVELTIYEEIEKGIIRYSIPPSRAEKSVSPTLNLLRSGLRQNEHFDLFISDRPTSESESG